MPCSAAYWAESEADDANSWSPGPPGPAQTSAASSSRMGALAYLEAAHGQLAAHFVAEANEGDSIAPRACQYGIEICYDRGIAHPTSVARRPDALHREARGLVPASIPDRQGAPPAVPARSAGMGPEVTLGTV